MVLAGDDDGAWLVIVDKLSDQALSSRFKVNVKRICILCAGCSENPDPGCLDPIPDQPSAINRDASLEWFERIY